MPERISDPDEITHLLLEAAADKSRLRVKTFNHNEFRAEVEPPQRSNHFAVITPIVDDAPANGEMYVLERQGYLLTAVGGDGQLTFHPIHHVALVENEVISL